MTTLTEAVSFDPVLKIYDLLDPVLGGLSGQSNDPIIVLANRTRYLHTYKNSFTGVQLVSANTLIDNTFLRKLIYISATGNITLTLAATSTFTDGQTLHFKCKNVAGKCVAIVPAAGQLITDGGLTKNIWLYDGEQISLVVRSATEWEVIDSKGNFDIAGNDGMVRKMPRNTLVADGSGGYLRADYARLWEQISADAIADSSWLSDPLTFRQLFSTGNGTTTFRVPDMRSMHWRGLDLGRGVSYSRAGLGAGSYELDQLKNHMHLIGHESTLTGGIYGRGSSHIIEQAGGTGAGNQNVYGFASTGDPLKVDGTAIALSDENTVKNAGLIPIIYF